MKIFSGVKNHDVVALACDAEGKMIAFLTEDDPSIYLSNDSGQSWISSVVTDSYGLSWESLSMSGSGQILAFVAYHYGKYSVIIEVRLSTDYGASWITLTTPEYFLPKWIICVVGMGIC